MGKTELLFMIYSLMVPIFYLKSFIMLLLSMLFLMMMLLIFYMELVMEIL